MNKTTQIAKIDNYCRIAKSITQRDALHLGVYRLASRIADMKRIGYWIATEYVRVGNADGTNSRIARYRIIKRPDEVMTNAENV